MKGGENVQRPTLNIQHSTNDARCALLTWTLDVERCTLNVLPKVGRRCA